MVGEHVHWYFYDGCNLDCAPCFQPHTHYNSSLREKSIFAHMLVNGGVEKVTLGGGEPMLAGKDLDYVLSIFRERGVSTSLHTNGTLLNGKRISELSGLVGDIALPIDSTNRKTQERLRGKGFLQVFDRLKNLAQEITSKGIGLGYHTVFTMANHNDMPGIYDLINRNAFDYWRAYEFNDYLAMNSYIEKHWECPSSDPEKFGNRLDEVRFLKGLVGKTQDDPDDLKPLFDRVKIEMGELGDERVQFCSITGVQEPYLFLDNMGYVTIYDCLSGMRRPRIGNIAVEGVDFVLDEARGYAGRLEEIRHIAIKA